MSILLQNLIDQINAGHGKHYVAGFAPLRNDQMIVGHAVNKNPADPQILTITEGDDGLSVDIVHYKGMFQGHGRSVKAEVEAFRDERMAYLWEHYPYLTRLPEINLPAEWTDTVYHQQQNHISQLVIMGKTFIPSELIESEGVDEISKFLVSVQYGTDHPNALDTYLHLKEISRCVDHWNLYE